MAVSGKNLSRWYREASQHLRAGVSLPRALEIAGGVPLRHRRKLAEQLRLGEDVESVLLGAPAWLPDVDRHVLASAGRSGKMSETLLILAKQRQFMARQAGNALASTLYPLFVVHLAVFLLPIYYLSVVVGKEDAGEMGGIGANIFPNAADYAAIVVPLLAGLWVVIAVFSWSVRRRQAWVMHLMRMVPLLRGHSQNQAVADLCFALGGYLTAGVKIDDAWAGAGKACRNRRIGRLATMVAEDARNGNSPAARIVAEGGLPEDFASLYQAGEMSGQLEENLQHLWQIYSERASRRLLAASFWYPKLLMIAVAIGVAYVVIQAYAAYWDSMLELL